MICYLRPKLLSIVNSDPLLKLSFFFWSDQYCLVDEAQKKKWSEIQEINIKYLDMRKGIFSVTCCNVIARAYQEKVLLHRGIHSKISQVFCLRYVSKFIFYIGSFRSHLQFKVNKGTTGLIAFEILSLPNIFAAQYCVKNSVEFH